MFKRGDCWYSKFYHEKKLYIKSWGKVKKTTATFNDGQYKKEVIEGKHLLKAKRILFENFALKYMEVARSTKKPNSHKRNASSIEMLKPHFSGKLLNEITPFMVEKYRKNKKDAGKMPATINRDTSTLNNMLNKAVDWGYLQINPLNRVIRKLKENNDKMWILSPDEEKNLLQQCEARPQHQKYLKDIVLFALNTGMREAEIFNLKKTSVDMQSGCVRVLNTKNNRNRAVPINDTVREILLRLLQSDSDYVFCNSRGEKLTVLTNAFWRAVKDAKLEQLEFVNGKQRKTRFRFHDLRHTFGSRLGMAGFDLKTIMEIMGHETTVVAMRYQHPTPEHKMNAVKFLDNFNQQTNKNVRLVKS